MTVLIAVPRLPEVANEEGTHIEHPGLPAFTRLLRRARRLPDAPDWQAGVMRALGLERVPAVAMAAAALPDLAAGSGICFAAPVHAVAGISRVHLPPGGRLVLDAAEEAAWRAAFNAEFGASGASLHAAAGGGGWLLVAPCAAGARDAAPELLEGEALQRSPAADEVQRALRRLGTEVEMWLASHALNRRRGQRGEPPLNAIWFWGGGQSGFLPAIAALRSVTGNRADAFLAGLAAGAGVPLADAGSWDEAMRSSPHPLPASAPEVQVLLVPPVPAGQSMACIWQGLEEQWFAPAEQALARGEIGALHVQLQGVAWHVARGSKRHWLRWSRRSWWQMVMQP